MRTSLLPRVRPTFLVLVAGLLVGIPLASGKLVAQAAPDSGEYAPDSGYEQPENIQQGYAQQPSEAPYEQPGYPEAGAGNAQGGGQMQPLNPGDLEQLVAPIALYPDALVAQVLTASTYPEQVADADHWLREQGYASPEQVAAGADAQPWDPSVKALTAFPRVLAQMDQNLHWTSDLGAAYYNQPQDTLDAVQEMRRRAHDAGNLQSTPQQAVGYEQGNYEVAPVNPEMVYVPSYNPWAVYGEPVEPYPGFSFGDAVGSFFASSAIRFGVGVALSAFTQAPWGWLGWGLDWLGHSILFDHSNYFSHSATVADWGLRYGGPRAFSRGAFTGRGYGGFGRSERNGFARYGRENGGYGRGFARTRNEDAYARNAAGNNRGSQAFGPHYGRPAAQSARGFQTASARSRYGSRQYGSQQYGSQRSGGSAYGSSYRGGGDSAYGRSGARYGRSMYSSSVQSGRGENGSFQRGGYGGRSSGNYRSSAGYRSSHNYQSSGYRGNSFGKSSGKQSHFGGSHFSGGHGSKNYGGGGKSFGHGHSGGGGHSSSHSSGHSGGGHSSGGGKHHH